MKELSLNILDIAKNSVTAGATLISISVEEAPEKLQIVIEDNGCGMTPEFVARVTDPFTTTRTTRKVGLGLPLMKMEANMAGGDLVITSEVGVGTVVTTWFRPDNIDTPPLGDLITTMVTLIQGSPELDFLFTHTTAAGSYTLDTREIREVMGDVSLAEPELLMWFRDFLTENEQEISVPASD